MQSTCCPPGEKRSLKAVCRICSWIS